jgi:gamma-glutamylcyclotransferase (GGCT)/AIG2-like uncharacterized protein YtfP
MPDLLFIYGTLHPDRAPAAIATTARLLKPFARATIQGRLYDLGAYPGVQLGSDPSGTVPGELFQLPDDASILARTVLARLDNYEDFRPDDPSNSLFLRQRTIATLEDGTQQACWVYTYNRAAT